MPGTVAVPACPFGPRDGATAGKPAAASACVTSGDSGMPLCDPVESSITIVFNPSRAVTSWMATGPSFPMAAVP